MSKIREIKTGKEWILKIAEKDRELAQKIIDNTKKLEGYEEYKIILNKVYESFSSFLGDAFLWYRAEEGIEYWSKVSEINIIK